MSKPRDGGGIRHRNREYNSQRGLILLVVTVAVVLVLIVFSVKIGIIGTLGETITDSMHTPKGNTTEQMPKSHTNSSADWRLSLNRSLDAQYTSNPDIAPIEVRTAQLEVIEFVNAQRAEHGVEPLFWNGALSRLNRWYAGEIDRIGGGNSSHYNQATERFIDERAKWAGYPVQKCTRYGEVITTSAYIGGPTATEKNAASITEGWMRSDSHREAILNEQYDVAGVGIFVAEDETRIAVMTLCDRSDIPDEELNGWRDARYRADDVAIPYDVAVAGGEWDSTKNLTETPTSRPDRSARHSSRSAASRSTSGPAFSAGSVTTSSEVRS